VAPLCWSREIGPRVLPSADRKSPPTLIPLCRLPCPLRVPDSRAG
jgi:hypothetical protein